jgi:hypothetical protein
MIKRLLTKPVWWWETRQSYPVRFRFLELPRLAVVPGVSRFVVLTTPAALPDAMWAAWSWYRYLRLRGFELQLAVDGILSDPELARIRELFPGISVYVVQPLCAELCDLQPGLAAFLEQHPLGKKLGLVLALSAKGAMLFSDYDVLAFREPEELLACMVEGIASYLSEESSAGAEPSVDPGIVELAARLGLAYDPRFNSGLLFAPMGALSIEVAAQLLSHWRPPVHWFTEQTVLNILMQHAHARPLPEERYVVSARRQFYGETDVDYGEIVARHFITPVRHLMYRKGIPLILEQTSEFAADEPG